MSQPTEPASEFLCPGCGRPLAITLRSDMCFAEAQVYCADCERDFQQRRGKWADLFAPVSTPQQITASPDRTKE
jgi:predicted RNA-binding Zn-ribbon protein involved in translation (DUF1610 family)